MGRYICTGLAALVLADLPALPFLGLCHLLLWRQTQLELPLIQNSQTPSFVQQRICSPPASFLPVLPLHSSFFLFLSHSLFSLACLPLNAATHSCHFLALR